MSAAAVASASSAPVDTLPVAADVLSATIDRVSPKDDALAAHAAVLKAGNNGDEVDKDALNKLVDVIGIETADPVSRDALLAHTLLLSVFHNQLRDGANEAKDLAFLCAAEMRYLTYLDALAMAIGKDQSLVETPPLPPMDVAMFWHSHMLSPVRFAEDMMRCYGDTFADMSLPLMRLAKVAIGTNKDDLEASREFWVKHLPADMPYDFTPADVDETQAVARVVCPFCTSELLLAMPEYAALRLHGKAHECGMCAAEFTAEHVAVHRFLTKVKNAPIIRMAGTQSHPKTREPMFKLRSNMADLAVLFDNTMWAKYAAKLPTLATWADVKGTVMAPIMKDAADALALPGNRLRFGMVVYAHKDVITGPWAMDMVRAVRRQRRFSAKMANIVRSGPSDVYHFQTEALVQYPKFLAMAVAHPRSFLVPTTAIDLSWHTHQLFPAVYRKHTLMLTGSVMNHDDSDDVESEARINEGGNAMEKLWMDTYGEEYLNVHVPCTQGAKYHMSEKELLALYLAPGVCNANHVDAAGHTARCGSWGCGNDATKDTATCARWCFGGCADISSGWYPSDATVRTARCGSWGCGNDATKDTADKAEHAARCGSWGCGNDATKDTAEHAARCGSWGCGNDAAKDTAVHAARC
ncbi:hypothetical protein GGF31_001329 [Allomyces arbusculus]|nr:hypothetical protein GGF31_001329 [Allomyces arbusculus]